MTLPFNFDDYAIKEEKNQQQTPTQEPPKQQQPLDFNKFLAEEEKSIFQKYEIGRHATRTGARALETVIGLPGDFVQFAKYLGDKLPEPPKFLQREPSFVQKAGRKALETLPTSQELQETSSYLTSGFTNPQGAKEKLGDEITSLATSLLIPSKDPKKFTGLLKAIGLATAAKSVGKAAEAYGASELTKGAAEIGTLVLLGQLGKQTAREFVGDQYQQAKAKIPNNVMVNTNQLVNDLSTIETDLSRGVSTATKNEVLGAVKELQAKATGGAMPGKDLIQAYHDINERMNAKKLFDELKKSDREILKRRYNTVKSAVSDAITPLGQGYPEAISQWRKANEAHAILSQTDGVKNFLMGNIKTIPGHIAAGAAIKLLTGAPMATAGALALPGAWAGRTLLRMSKSPTLKTYYLKAMQEAAKENLPATLKSLEKFDAELIKDEKRDNLEK